MIQNFLRYIKLLVPSQNATIGSGLSPVLGQFGLSISQFCKDFNNNSNEFEFDTLVNVKLSLLKNKTFTFELNSIPTAFLFFKILDNKLNDKIDLFINKFNNLDKKISFNIIQSYYLNKRLEII